MEHDTTAEEQRRWDAVLRRDASAEGQFVYGVTSTGVYCRPGCPARHPKRQNVLFFPDSHSAEQQGFRACLRCHPRQASRTDKTLAAIQQACRLIEQAEQPPTLHALAQVVGISAYHFQRQFKAITGLTPKAYAEAHRARAVRAALNDPATTVTQALYQAGYSSGSRFYEQTNGILGMTPTAYKNGGADSEIRFALGECSLGAILVACSAKGICAILLGDDPERLLRDLQDHFPRAHLLGGDTSFEQLVAQVVGYIETPALGLALPLDIQGTAFQQRVWQALREIPAGQTVSYSEIANRIGAPRAVRAVGTACGANRIAVAIPCHRVLRTDGSLSGYRWGIERKRALLEREKG